MKQVLQSLKTGKTILADIPQPQIGPGKVLIKSHCSLISSGTEKMLIDFGKASLLDKARQQPEKVQMVFDKIKTDGLLPTLAAIRAKLDKLLPMGYSNVGTVVAVAADVTEFKVGDRVVSNGNHAEIITVAKNLCCKIPETVSDEAATFTVVGAIALQGIRLVEPTLGETIVVIGLGLIGLLTTQLLKAQGCMVLGIDIAQDKVELAKQMGIDAILMQDIDLENYTKQFSRQRGIDAVIITAATKSNDPIKQAATICRKRGRIVLVGVTGLELNRSDFYEKELRFQVSCSYGPGRYDETYEEGCQDYPIGFVRWTAQRNFEAVLDMLAQNRIDVSRMITHRFAFEEVAKAYDLLTTNKASMAILLDYPKEINLEQSIKYPNFLVDASAVNLGFIGAGNYANRTLLPVFKNMQVACKTIACTNGVSGMLAANKFGFHTVTTNVETIFGDQNINAVIVASRHDSHAQYVCQALQMNKHIFVEKPLCITQAELNQIQHYLIGSLSILMVGFNRRFAPHVVKIKELLSKLYAAKTFIMTVNAGEIPLEHWTQDKKIGGGRIIGEVCHFIDLLRHLANCKISDFYVNKILEPADDKVIINLKFEDGSIGIINYLANGHRAFPKERLEIFCAGKILQLNNFRQLHGYGFKNFKKMNLWRQDKGQSECVKQFITAIQTGKQAPIPIEETIEVMQLTLNVANSI